MKTISKLKKELDKWFSLFIRLRDSEDGTVECFTCGKRAHYKDNMQCGHFQSRRFLATRFNSFNCQIQCSGCNVFRFGEQFKFALALDVKYGQGTSEDLQQQTREIVKISRAEYEDKITYYKNIVKNLKNDIGIV